MYVGLPTKIVLISLGIFVGILLTFGASDKTVIIKEKTQEQKDFFNLIARLASFVSIAVLFLIIFKKIPMRPKWSYFVTGLAATYSIINIGILTIFPNLLDFI